MRWFGAEPGYHAGFREGWIPKIGFVESSDDYAFGFLDPSLIIRGCHLIPTFHAGRTSELLPFDKSATRILDASETDDWVNYYVSM